MTQGQQGDIPPEASDKSTQEMQSELLKARARIAELEVSSKTSLTGGQ